MNNVTMQDYTQDYSLTQDAQGSQKRQAAQFLLCWRRVPIYLVHKRQTPKSQK